MPRSRRKRTAIALNGVSMDDYISERDGLRSMGQPLGDKCYYHCTLRAWFKCDYRVRVYVCSFDNTHAVEESGSHEHVNESFSLGLPSTIKDEEISILESSSSTKPTQIHVLLRWKFPTILIELKKFRDSWIKPGM